VTHAYRKAGQTTATKTPLGATILDNNGLPLGTAGGLPVWGRGGFRTPTASCNRPADTIPYAAGDLIANSVSAAAVAPLAFANAVRAPGEAIRIEGLRLRKSSPSLANAVFRVMLLRSVPVFSVGDNGALLVGSVLAMDDTEHRVGSFDVTMDRAAAAGAMGDSLVGVRPITVTPVAGTTLYAVVQALAAYTPASAEMFRVTLEGAVS
jgi:hypothetical protein